MLFVTVGYGSAALLEGIALGIPGMMVTQTGENFYSALLRGIAPVGDTEVIIEHIKKCLDDHYYTQLSHLQIS
jgi:hypothetical protein